MLNPEQMNGTVIFYAHKAMQLELIAAQMEQRALAAEREATQAKLELAALRQTVSQIETVERELTAYDASLNAAIQAGATAPNP